MFKLAQGRNGLTQGHAAQQHVLINTRERRTPARGGRTYSREGLGRLANGFALGIGFLPIDESGVDENIEDGALLSGVH